MGYSIDTITADCYEGTTCLRNKFGIKDDSKINTDDLMSATIQAANGIDVYLKSIFAEAIIIK